ncbi:VOC family protein [Cytophagaceae bacterium ABcell3]|nr:VOC family protein [Cytophagaceae bacterium ABcell3]
MIKRIYVNLPVKNLKMTMEFFTNLGFAFDANFSDERAACLILGDNMYAMLLTESFFQTFTQKRLADAKQNTEVLVALEVKSREQVDELVSKAVKAGGTIYRGPEDHGWMYNHCFADLDGHQWEVLFTDESKLSEK